MTPENCVKAEVLKYLKLRRIKAWSNLSGAVRIRPGKFMSFGLKGSSDILGLLPGGRFLVIECKAKGGQLSPEQREFLSDIKVLGGMAVGEALDGHRPGVERRRLCFRRAAV
jgi:hypothetical protein